MSFARRFSAAAVHHSGHSGFRCRFRAGSYPHRQLLPSRDTRRIEASTPLLPPFAVARSRRTVRHLLHRVRGMSHRESPNHALQQNRRIALRSKSQVHSSFPFRSASPFQAVAELDSLGDSLTGGSGVGSGCLASIRISGIQAGGLRLFSAARCWPQIGFHVPSRCLVSATAL